MDNLRAIIFMCLAMAGFALEDFIIKIIAEETPISQILITIGCLGTVLFSFIALAVKAPIFNADILTFPVIFRSIADLFGALFFVKFYVAVTILPGLITWFWLKRKEYRKPIGRFKIQTC